MEVKNLIEYMEIVCGKIMSYPLESNHTDNKYLSQMNSIGKEFILRTSSQSGIKTDKKIPEELCEYIILFTLITLKANDQNLQQKKTPILLSSFSVG